MNYRKMIARKLHGEEENHMGSIALALLAGATIGAAITLLLAPKSGAETRTLICDRTKALADGVKSKLGMACDKAEEELSEVADQAKQTYKSARKRVKKSIEDASDSVDI